MVLQVILLVFSFVLAIVAAANVPPAGRWQWGWLAFAFYIAALLFGNALQIMH